MLFDSVQSDSNATHLHKPEQILYSPHFEASTNFLYRCSKPAPHPNDVSKQTLANSTRELARAQKSMVMRRRTSGTAASTQNADPWPQAEHSAAAKRSIARIMLQTNKVATKSKRVRKGPRTEPSRTKRYDLGPPIQQHTKDSLLAWLEQCPAPVMNDFHNYVIVHNSEHPAGQLAKWFRNRGNSKRVSIEKRRVYEANRLRNMTPEQKEHKQKWAYQYYREQRIHRNMLNYNHKLPSSEESMQDKNKEPLESTVSATVPATVSTTVQTHNNSPVASDNGTLPSDLLVEELLIFPQQAQDLSEKQDDLPPPPPPLLQESVPVATNVPEEEMDISDVWAEVNNLSWAATWNALDAYYS